MRPAIRSLLRRLAFWFWAGALFWLFGLAGAWPDGDPAAISPDSQAAGHWPRLALVLYILALAASWLVSRTRLVRHGRSRTRTRGGCTRLPPPSPRSLQSSGSHALLFLRLARTARRSGDCAAVALRPAY
jgi:hypothetical protein